jgi:hypothetical protein
MRANLSYKPSDSKPIPRPLRAMIEIDGYGSLRIFPLVDCDTDEKRVMDALRFFLEDAGQ